jgi:hypothetical protein
LSAPKPLRNAREPVEVADELAVMVSQKRQRLVKVGANAAIFVGLLAGPYVRGYFRARAQIEKHAELAACIYGGTPAVEPGLGMPVSAERYFAARLIAHEADYPRQCIAMLEDFVPEPATFVFPGVKRAEAGLADARELVLKELRPLALHVPSSRVPTRPLRALDRLRGVVAEHALAGGFLEVPKSDAIDFRDAAHLAQPTRVPLYAQSDARIHLSGHDGELRAVAVDARGVSFVAIGHGGMDQRRTPRPKLMEDFLPRADGGSFVWAVARHRCRDRENGCSNKSMGMAATSVPWTDMPTPRWLGAHPASRIDRAVHVEDGRVVVLAELSEGLRTLRRFGVELSAVPESAEMPPLKALSSSPERFVGDGQVLMHGAVPSVIAPQRLAAEPGRVAADPVAQPDLLRLTLLPVEAGADPVELSRAGLTKGEPWVVACSSDTELRFVWGDETRFQAGYLARDGQPHVYAPVELHIEHPVDATDTTFDHLRVRCPMPGRDAARDVRLLARDAQGRVHAFAAPDGAEALRDTTVATDIRAFDAMHTSHGMLLAFAGISEGAQVRIASLDGQGQLRVAPSVPAACYSPAGGLCGAPILARIGERVVLGAREGTDMLALESSDDGAHFQGLRGLGRTD